MSTPYLKGLYEDKFYQDASKVISDLNTDAQIQRGQFYRIIYMQLSAEMNARETGNSVVGVKGWRDIERAYKCKRDVIEDSPNSFIPVLTPIIEGQVATSIDKDITVSVRGKSISDQNFASTGQMLVDLAFKENKIKQVIKIAFRRYLLYGMGVFSVGWNPDMYDGIGMAEIRAPQITRIFVDGKIKELNDFQKADWVMEELGFKSIEWVRRNFGDDMANAVIKLNHIYSYEEQSKYDDLNATSIILVWTRNNKHGSLQKIVMDKRGLILSESDPETPYFEFVDNKYPYFFFGMYSEEGNFYRFGDGSLLLPIQDTVNKIYDEIITNIKFCSQPRTFMDPAAACDVDQISNDPSQLIAAQNPRENIYIQPPVAINQVVFQLLHELMNEAQKATRFSALMSGNNPEQQMTATQAGIQSQQGNQTINDKKMDLSDALAGVARYCLGLTMEFIPAAIALQVNKSADKFEWVDPRQLANVPIMVPADDAFQNKWRKNHPNSPVEEIPYWMHLENEDGETQTKNATFDIDVSVGEGLPTNKIAIYNILLSLAQLQLIDETTGQPKPILGYQQFKNMAEDLLGITLEDGLEEAKKNMPMMMPQDLTQQSPLNVSPNVPGANINGNIGGNPIAV